MQRTFNSTFFLEAMMAADGMLELDRLRYLRIRRSICVFGFGSATGDSFADLWQLKVSPRLVNQGGTQRQRQVKFKDWLQSHRDGPVRGMASCMHAGCGGGNGHCSLLAILSHGSLDPRFDLGHCSTSSAWLWGTFIWPF